MSAVEDLSEADDDANLDHTVLEIVPCSMLESGLSGQVCADAAMYVVTSSGVVLCEIARPEPDTTVEEQSCVDCAPSATRVITSSTVLVPPADQTVRLPRPMLRTVASPLETADVAAEGVRSRPAPRHSRE